MRAFEASDLDGGKHTVVAFVGQVQGSLVVEVPAEGSLDIRIRLEPRQ